MRSLLVVLLFRLAHAAFERVTQRHRGTLPKILETQRASVLKGLKQGYDDLCRNHQSPKLTRILDPERISLQIAISRSSKTAKSDSSPERPGPDRGGCKGRVVRRSSSWFVVDGLQSAKTMSGQAIYLLGRLKGSDRLVHESVTCIIDHRAGLSLSAGRFCSKPAKSPNPSISSDPRPVRAENAYQTRRFACHIGTKLAGPTGHVKRETRSCGFTSRPLPIDQPRVSCAPAEQCGQIRSESIPFIGLSVAIALGTHYCVQQITRTKA